MITSVFTAKHSSILRILTKWAEYLEDIFKRPKDLLYGRLYPFKNYENELVPSCISSIIKPILIERLEQEYRQVKQKFQTILKSNYHFVGTFLCSDT
jgi:hypothetical protein